MLFRFTSFSGLQKMGDQARRGTAASRHRHDARSAVLSELRSDLVRLDAARGRADQVQVVRALARAHARLGTAVQLGRFREGVPVSRRVAHEPRQQMRRLVEPRIFVFSRRFIRCLVEGQSLQIKK